MLTINNLTKSYNNFNAVDNISFRLESGDFTAFLGPNGAGKTTTIKMIAGLLAPSSGSIKLINFDSVINHIQLKQNLGYIPDQPFLYDKLTGLEFLKLTGGLFGLRREELKKKIDETLELLSLGDWINRKTETYSQGMRQRVSIASSLLHNPDLILVDEPMVGLDPQSANIVKKAFQQKAVEGKTILISTHSLHIAEEICTRVIILNKGKIIFDDKIEAFKTFHAREYKNLEAFFLELTKDDF